MTNKIDVNLVQRDPEKVKRYFEELNEFSELEFASGLPDCEANLGKVVSAVASFEGSKIMPGFLPNVINCGMALMRIDIDPSIIQEHSKAIMEEIHEGMKNEAWNLSATEFESILQHGAAAFCDLYVPEKSPELKRMHGNGETQMASLVKKPRSLDQIVPKRILDKKQHFLMPENRIRKNHFLEFYNEANLKGETTAEQSATYCAFHFETTFSEELNGYYQGVLQKDVKKALVNKNPLKVLYRLLRLSGHIAQRVFKNGSFHLAKRGEESFLEILKHFIFLSQRQVMEVDSPIGQKYLQAYSYAANHSSAARLAMMLHIARSIKKVLGKEVNWEIIWEAGHDILEPSHQNNGSVVHRIGSVPVSNLEYGFVAGLYNVPSILMKRTESPGGERSTSWRDSYDHGVGNVLSKYGDVTQGKKVGEIERFRADSKTAKISGDKITKEDVYYNSGLEKVLKLYADSAAPVTPQKLLIPFISYKWIWKNAHNK
jgi:RNA-splicing ligase RtcB